MYSYFCYYGLLYLNVHFHGHYGYGLYDSFRYFLQYDMIGYYLFVCMIYVVVIFFSLYGSAYITLL